MSEFASDQLTVPLSSQSEAGSSEFDLKGKPERGTASTYGVAFNIGNSLVGGGVLGLPFAFRQAGILPGILGILALAAMSAYTFQLVPKLRAECRRRAGSSVKEYGDIGYVAFGRPGAMLVTFALVSAQLGICIAYLIFIAKNMDAVIPGMTHEQIVLAACPFMIGFSWIRNIKSLSPLSVLANVFCVAGIAVVLASGLWQNQWADDVVVAEVSSLPLFFGIAAFGYAATANALGIESSMRSPQKFNAVVYGCHGFVALMYCAFGLMSYLFYGQATDSIITANLDPDSPVTILCEISLSLVVFGTFPIQLFPILSVLEKGILGAEPSTGAVTDPDSSPDAERADIGQGQTVDYVLLENDPRQKETHMEWSTPCCKVPRVVQENILRALVVAVIVAVSAFLPFFGLVANLVGSFSLSLIAFILPASFNLRLRQMGSAEVVWNVLILLCGVVGMVCGSVMAVTEIIQKF
eukprot:GFYU01003050.1.p1 GENE.GFYU01003050.1~~GFYU01003050.1.p1  ORF type:complete len:467 (-),score=123.04 GFYU01003050.1:117-1517(-)